MPSNKKGKNPWWYSPSVWDIMFTTDAVKESGLHSLKLHKIASTMADKPFPTRPKRARHNWLESVTVDGVLYELSCCVDDYQNKEFIVVRNIRTHKKLR